MPPEQWDAFSRWLTTAPVIPPSLWWDLEERRPVDRRTPQGLWLE